MLKKIKINKMLIVGILMMFLIVSINVVQANFQSKPKDISKPTVGAPGITNLTADDMFVRARNMEKEGEVLGKNATIDENGNETGTNNIDAHMMKSTEWGAVAYLSNSIYGQQLNNTDNSTMNPYGVMDLKSGRFKYLSSILSTSTSVYISKMKLSPTRYKDSSTNTSFNDIPGIAMEETKGWFGGVGNRSKQQFSSSFASGGVCLASTASTTALVRLLVMLARVLQFGTALAYNAYFLSIIWAFRNSIRLPNIIYFR